MGIFKGLFSPINNNSGNNDYAKSIVERLNSKKQKQEQVQLPSVSDDAIISSIPNQPTNNSEDNKKSLNKNIIIYGAIGLGVLVVVVLILKRK
jgi:hypothetical protein